MWQNLLGRNILDNVGVIGCGAIIIKHFEIKRLVDIKYNIVLI